MIALRNYIYVYGGIQGASSQPNNEHFPELATVLVERYTAASDSWEAISVNLAPRLAAFSWCQMGDTS